MYTPPSGTAGYFQRAYQTLVVVGNLNQMDTVTLSTVHFLCA